VSIAWDTVQRAIQRAIVAASGLPSSSVQWNDQNIARPAAPCITIGVLTFTPVGQVFKSTAPNPLVLADDVVESVDASANTLTLTAHAMLTGDGPLRLTTTGSLAGTGLAVATDYWAIKSGANTVQFAASFQDAMDGVAIDITGAGTGVHTIVNTAETLRAGAEVMHTFTGIRDVVLSIQCFAATGVGAAASFAILDTMITAMAKPSVRDALRRDGKCGLTFSEAVPVNGAEFKAAVFEPRATTRARLFLHSEATEAGGIIEVAQVSINGGPVTEVRAPGA
jgi:hypothetical protein